MAVVERRRPAGREGDVNLKLRQSETTGRSLGNNAWIEQLEHQTGKILRPRKRGPKVAGETD